MVLPPVMPIVLPPVMPMVLPPAIPILDCERPASAPEYMYLLLSLSLAEETFPRRFEGEYDGVSCGRLIFVRAPPAGVREVFNLTKHDKIVKKSMHTEYQNKINSEILTHQTHKKIRVFMCSI